MSAHSGGTRPPYDDIAAENRDLVDRYGPWTAARVELAPGIMTRPEHPAQHADVARLRQVVQVVSDVVGKPLNETRILDLGCLEGAFSLEFAAQGARVVGLEVREANAAKARFASRALGLDNLEVVTLDARELSAERFGRFDVVLCLGLLYHLDAVGVFDVLERIAGVCDRVLLLDTHTSLHDDVAVSYDGQEYWGAWYEEHGTSDTSEMKEDRLWASADNPRSFWLTRSSLVNAVAQVGFTSISECLHPPVPVPGFPSDRLRLLCLRGTPERVLTWVNEFPIVNTTPEHVAFTLHPSQRPVLGRSSWRAWGEYYGRQLVRQMPPSVRERLLLVIRAAG